MHRWFFADDHIICRIPEPPPSPPKTPRTPSPSSLPDTCWKFCVKFEGKLCSNECLAVCGSCSILGKWDVQNCLPLNIVEDSQCWTSTITLPRKYDVRYRYLVCATNGRGRRIVRFWETHHGARLISRNAEQDLEANNCDIFGLLQNIYKIERGWLTSDIIVVQLKFYRAPFSSKMHAIMPLMFVKITPIKVQTQETCRNVPNLKLNLSESEVVGEDVKDEFAFCEVASLEKCDGGFRCQPKYGTSCGTDEILMFNLTLSDIENTAYLIDLYNYPPKAAADVPPYHYGYQYVLPQQLKGSEGTLKLTIICATKHRPIGSMKCEYLLVKPLAAQNFIMKETFQRYWNKKKEGLDIGHRGCGKSFWFRNNILRESTMNSFKFAFEHGADMVEFDVHLTKDLVPILYHDFQLYISRDVGIDQTQYDLMRLPLEVAEINYLKTFVGAPKSGLLRVPLNKFTLKQLKRVKVYEVPANRDQKVLCNLDKWKYNRPFQTLRNVLKKVDIKLGFVIEIKWPQRFDDGTMSENFTPDIDKNEYVDVILDLVLRNAGRRRIIFTSFEADICTMIRLKQNRYPALFLVHCNNNEKKLLDPRSDQINTSINFANAMELLGIFPNSADVEESPCLVSDTHKRDLCVFCWGNDNRLAKKRSHLKTLGVDGIVFDRINHVLQPDDLKQNIFLINLIESPVKEESEECRNNKSPK